MIYREAGHFKTSYASDQAIFPIVQDRWFVMTALAVYRHAQEVEMAAKLVDKLTTAVKTTLTSQS